MTSEPYLPDLHTAELDAHGLNALLADIAALGEVTEIIPKQAAREQVTDGATPLALDDVPGLFAKGARGVQIRYRFEGAEWWDTLMALPGGAFRLVRIQHDFSNLTDAE